MTLTPPVANAWEATSPLTNMTTTANVWLTSAAAAMLASAGSLEPANATTAGPYKGGISVMDTVFVSVVAVASLLSIPSCIALIVMHVMWKDVRTTGRAMLVQLSVADLLTAVGNLMGIMWFLFKDSKVLNRAKWYCDTHSSMTIFSSIASFFWTTVTALSLFLVLVRHSHNTASKYWKVIWVVCWGVPTVVGVSALAFDVLGYDPLIESASWCWIAPTTRNQVVWNFMTGKAWELLAYFMTCVLYTAVRISLLRQKAQSDKVLKEQLPGRRDRVHDANIKLMFIPLVFIVLRLWGTLRFLVGLDYRIANSPYATWISPLQGFGDTAQGFCNFAMDVLFTPKIRNRMLCREHPRLQKEISSDLTRRKPTLVTVCG